MIPSILLGGEEHLVIRRKIKRAVRGEFGEGIVGCVSTMPNFFSIAGRGVCNPQLLVRSPNRKLSVSRKLGVLAILLATAHFAQQARSSAFRVHSPDLLFAR